jgi:GTPase involved in cell partitioning and DNA repair
MENDNLVERYRTMRKEFKKISKELYSMEELIVLTKADIYTPEEAKVIGETFEEEIGKEALTVSTYLKDSLIDLNKAIKSKLDSLQN